VFNFAKQLAKNLLWLAVRFSGLPWLIREVWRRNQVGIMVYHDPEPKIFHKHISFLSKHYNFIGLSQLVNAIHQQNWSSIPNKALVITIDDGHKNNYALLETIRAFQLQPTIFVCSHIVDTQRHFWWKNGYPNNASLKQLTRTEMLQRLHDEVGYSPKKNYPDRQALSREEMQEMQAAGVDFQAHTCFHPILPHCSAEESWQEINECRHKLEHLLGRTVAHFAYPNGDYSDRDIQYLKQAGFHSARTMDFGWNTLNTDLFKLKALDINESASISKLAAQLTGVFYWFKPHHE